MAARIDEPARPGKDFVHLPARLWKLLVAVGLLTWMAAAIVTEVTDDTILIPTIIIVGSFMVPVAMAAFALSRRRDGYLTTEGVALGFLPAGTAGLVGAALLESYLLPKVSGTFAGVGIFEELGTGAVLLLVAHQVAHRGPRDGMILATVVQDWRRYVRASAVKEHASSAPATFA